MRTTKGVLWQLTGILFTLSAASAAYQDEIGLYDLRARDASLTGTGVVVGQVEAGTGTQFDEFGNIVDEGDWQTDPANMALNSNIFTYFTTATPYPTGASFDSSRESSHANTVGGRFFADPSAADGVAPSVSEINVFYASYFYNSLILTSTDTSTPIINQSFVFGSLNSTVDQNYDNYADNFGVLFSNGVNTNTATATIPSPASSYNGITVSAINYNITPLADGRSKPDIVAPGSSAASFTAPLVAGAAAVLYQSGQREDGGPGTASDATDPRTLKALLLNSATKPVGWSNSPTHPLDTINGAGILELNNAQLQLVAGRHNPTRNEVLTVAGTAHPPPSGETGNVASYSGWNLGSVTNTADSIGDPKDRAQYDVTDHYFFDLSSSVANAFYLTSTLVWNRQSGRSSINNLDLFLYTEAGTLVASSVSSVDNVEHLYEQHLAPGRYVLQVHKPYNNGRITDAETYALAFNFRPAPSPEPPGSVTATAVSASEIDLSWVDNSDDETGYLVERRLPDESYSTIDTLAANSTSYVDSGLASGTTYEYRVTAFNAAGNSASVETSGTTYTLIEDWRLHYFGTAANSGDAADDYDYDFDSRANLIEFVTGSDPTVFSPATVDSSLLGSNGQISFDWRIGTSYDFSIGFSTDLTAGFTYYDSATLDADSSPDLEHIGTTPPVNDLETRTYQIRESVTAPQVFLRLQVN